MLKLRKKMAWIGVAAAASLALAGCSTSSTDTSGEGAESGESLEGQVRVIDTEFGPVELPEGDPADWKVVALGWSDAEAALAVGIQPVGVYDWMNFGEADKGVGPWATELFGDVDPVVWPNVDFTYDYEAIATLEPDLILNVRSAMDPEQHEHLEQIAPTLGAPKGAAPYTVDWREHAHMIADALERQSVGDQAVAASEQALESLKEDNPEFHDVTAVVGTKFGDAYGVYLPGDTRWDLVEALGFSLYPPVKDLEAEGYYADVSAEQVSVFDADVAVFFPIGYSLDEMEQDPLLSSLDVVKDGRAVMLAEDSKEAEAFSAGSVLSVPLAATDLVPQLQEAVSNLK